MLEEKTTSDWIYSFLVHFLKVFEKGTKWDFICWLYKTHMWEQI